MKGEEQVRCRENMWGLAHVIIRMELEKDKECGDVRTVEQEVRVWG